jgi:hypothetical protein
MQPTPNDYISALEQQRNDALNQLANAMAAVAALTREKDAIRAELERQSEKAD